MYNVYDERFESIPVEDGIELPKKIRYYKGFIYEITPIKCNKNDYLIECPIHCRGRFQYKPRNMSKSIKIKCRLIDKPILKCRVLNLSLFISRYMNHEKGS